MFLMYSVGFESINHVYSSRRRTNSYSILNGRFAVGRFTKVIFDDALLLKTLAHV